MSDSDRVTIRVVAAEVFERPVRLRLPFRYGSVTLREAPQAFVRVRIASRDGRGAAGAAAEMMAPRWFAKRPESSEGQDIARLAASLRRARDAYAGAGEHTAFGLSAALHQPLRDAGTAAGLDVLECGFGAALFDRAVLDALCRLRGVGVGEALRRNLPGIEPGVLCPDLASFDTAAWLRDRRLPPRMSVRHTVGLVDALDASDPRPGLDDGLPETLSEVADFYRPRYFKIKVAGRVDEDVVRLERIVRVLTRSGIDWRATVDGNEQYREPEAVQALAGAIAGRPALAELARRMLFLEQPFDRSIALETDVAALGLSIPVAIDESDAGYDSFTRARELGYMGVSAKGCKGIWKSALNAMRCARWNEGRSQFAPRWFLTGEDLSCQAGLSVQQDLAWAGLLGIEHVERNGHHYVYGMAGCPAAEQQAFAVAHPDLYTVDGPVTRLHVRDGEVAIGSLDAPGFASCAAPDWHSMRPLT